MSVPALPSLRRVSPEGPEWSELLARHPHLLFHEPAWARVTEAGFSAEAHALVWGDGEHRGGLLGFVFRKAWATFFYASHPYGGVVGEVPPADALAAGLRDFAREAGIARIRIVDAPGLPETGLSRAHTARLGTHLLDFAGRDAQTVLAALPRSVRRAVRRAGERGLVVETRSDAAAADAFYDLYLASMARNAALPKYARALVRAVLAQLGPSGRARVLLALRDGEPVAGLLLADSAASPPLPGTVHYLMGGSRSDALADRPNDLLFHHALRDAVERGQGVFDFLPSGLDDPKLEQFKAKWGAAAVPLAVHTLDVRPIAMGLWEAAARVAELPPVRRALLYHRRSR